MRLMCFLASFFLASVLCGQSSYSVQRVLLKDMRLTNTAYVAYWGTAGELPESADPFLSMNIEWRSTQPIPASAVRIRYQRNDSYSPWLALSQDEHAGDGRSRCFTNMVFLEPDTRLFHIRLDVDHPWHEYLIDTLIIHLFDPGPTGTIEASMIPASESRSEDCACAPPSLVDRSQWCPDGSCLPHPAPEPVFPTHLIIHHSAGSNSSSDWAAVVRSIWNFHVNVNGWSDIGYNWLVDPDGQIYVGRGDNILGAHFCGKNSNTLGTCVMGDFTLIQPTTEAIDALSNLYAWKACVEEIDPLASSFHPASGAVIPNVSGHRQSCQTSCPGDAFFPMLQQVREQIGEVIASCDCDLAVPSSLHITSLAGQVRLTWASVPGAIAYRIERKGPSDPDFMLLTQVGPTEHTDLHVQTGQIYQYRVRALDGTCVSETSDQVAILVPDDWFEVWPTLVTEGEVSVSIRNQTADPVNITVYGMDGRLVWGGTFGKSTIDFLQIVPMAQVPAGIYVLRVRHGSASRTLRLSKS